MFLKWRKKGFPIQNRDWLHGVVTVCSITVWLWFSVFLGGFHDTEKLIFCGSSFYTGYWQMTKVFIFTIVFTVFFCKNCTENVLQWNGVLICGIMLICNYCLWPVVPQPNHWAFHWDNLQQNKSACLCSNNCISELTVFFPTICFH